MGSAKSVRVKELETVFAGRRNSMGGSFARTGLPLAMGQTAYNANNQLTQWGTANLFYDLNGNMTSDGTHSYAWDARNRLSQIDLGNTASFVYDPFGRRVSKTILGTQAGFLYDRANPVQELSGTTPTANLLSGSIDEVFQRADSAGARSFLTDALGSTLALTDSVGTAQTQYTFEPFGNTTLSGATTTNSFAYTGRELDATGLQFNRARYYSPALQRFISEDPSGAAAGTKLYGYVSDDPMNRIDPFGLTDIVITVTRVTSTSNSTTGTIHVDAGDLGSVDTYSLEPPIGGDAIPPGSYPAHWRPDSGPGLDHQAVELDASNGLGPIQIHPGNTANDTSGCILPGLTVSQDFVGQSRDATGLINELILSVIEQDFLNGENTNITVNVNNSFPKMPGRK